MSLTPNPLQPGTPPPLVSPFLFEENAFPASTSNGDVNICSKVWFTDGNIILSAKGVLFKVHRGQLIRHSEVFRDIFALAQPGEGVVQFEGCDIIELHDSPEDVQYLLRALYDGLYYKHLCADDFRVVSSVLRLSTKYFIEHLRDRCISRLVMDWPDMLVTWDEREREATDSAGRYNPRARFPHPIHVISFARQIGVNSILSSAFYDLCRYGPSKIIAGAPILSNPSDTSLHPPMESEFSHLSMDDVKIALAGREAAQRATAAFIEEELSTRNISATCHNKERENGRVCRESFYFIMLNLLRSLGGIASGRDSDPLYTLLQAEEMMSRKDFSDGVQLCSLKLCAACKMDFSRSVRVARERVWTEIPTWFGMKDFSGQALEV